MSVSRARSLRKNQTEAERTLWNAVRSKRLDGWKFRRQHPIGVYIVDFVCLERKLIVELDGGHHADGAQKSHDVNRDAWLEGRGYSVIRVWNLDVLNNLEGVLLSVSDALRTPPP